MKWMNYDASFYLRSFISHNVTLIVRGDSRRVLNVLQFRALREWHSTFLREKYVVWLFSSYTTLLAHTN